MENGQPEFNDLLKRMGSGKGITGARAIILLDVWKVCLVLPRRYEKAANSLFVGSNIVWIWRSHSCENSVYRGRRSHSGDE